ncbi:sulfurtransferase TusA family protein [Thiohalophilus sp.]|uniref:sulfurtransferase TusA family protein n=1 Tax=Thiohalophilus sp. TaxID=3028392 RepID=UPI003976EF2D
MVFVSAHKLDARRLLCPMPVIRVQDAIAVLAPGEILEVTCTDPGTLNDIPAWCRINGHRILDTTQQDNEIVIRIEVGNGND